MDQQECLSYLALDQSVGLCTRSHDLHLEEVSTARGSGWVCDGHACRDTFSTRGLTRFTHTVL
jgi:hypothetical protein